MNSDAQRAANRKYRARKRAEAKAASTVNPNRRRPASAKARLWNSQQFAGSRPSKFKLPENHSRCSHCGGWGHLAWDHLDAHQFTGLGLIESTQRHFPEVAGKPGPWRYLVFQCVGEITMQQQQPKSFLRQAAEKIALIRSARQIAPTEDSVDRFDRTRLRELQTGETLSTVRTLIPVVDETSGSIAWNVDHAGMASYTPMATIGCFDAPLMLVAPVDFADDPEFADIEAA
jgi:hypothetical protein